MSVLNTPMDNANNEIIGSLVKKLATAHRRLDMIQFRATEALGEVSAIPDGHTWDRKIKATNGLHDVLAIIASDDV